MKQITNNLRFFLLLTIMSVSFIASAHPGHSHSDIDENVFVHFLTTYYIYFVPVAIVGVYLIKKYIKSSEKEM